MPDLTDPQIRGIALTIHQFVIIEDNLESIRCWVTGCLSLGLPRARLKGILIGSGTTLTDSGLSDIVVCPQGAAAQAHEITRLCRSRRTLVWLDCFYGDALGSALLGQAKEDACVGDDWHAFFEYARSDAGGKAAYYYIDPRCLEYRLCVVASARGFDSGYLLPTFPDADERAFHTPRAVASRPQRSRMALDVLPSAVFDWSCSNTNGATQAIQRGLAFWNERFPERGDAGSRLWSPLPLANGSVLALDAWFNGTSDVRHDPPEPIAANASRYHEVMEAYRSRLFDQVSTETELFGDAARERWWHQLLKRLVGSCSKAQNDRAEYTLGLEHFPILAALGAVEAHAAGALAVDPHVAFVAALGQNLADWPLETMEESQGFDTIQARVVPAASDLTKTRLAILGLIEFFKHIIPMKNQPQSLAFKRMWFELTTATVTANTSLVRDSLAFCMEVGFDTTDVARKFAEGYCHGMNGDWKAAVVDALEVEFYHSKSSVIRWRRR